MIIEVAAAIAMVAEIKLIAQITQHYSPICIKHNYIVYLKVNNRPKQQMKNPATILTIDAHQSKALQIPPFEKRQACFSKKKTYLLNLNYKPENVDLSGALWVIDAMEVDEEASCTQV